ncbi:MAG TPA: PQQ-binding-like beta-propeller repeat protein [Geminicoccaceae bacterium]|nr:PQQ-binding-like beta-propeller repeat protein [Geminicoccaceae bacterium]
MATSAFAIDPSRIEMAHKNPNDWLTYHGSYKSWHYSPLDQINADTVKNLKVAWMHFPGRSTRGLQSMPLAADGVVYYSGSYSRLYALDGATGKVLWAYVPELNEDLVAAQTHSPYNRGIALGHGNVYVGTVDGRLIAVDMKTGRPVWDTKLVDSEKLTVGFTGAPLVVKDKVVIGAQGGEWPGRGPIFGVDAKTGEKKWEFLTVAATEEAKQTWGNESWRTGGGGGWMAGAYDPETDTVLWGTGNPAPLYDWAGAKWETEGPRPGDNLYTSSVIGLDPDTGELKNYFQELPHDAWDFDSAVGEFVFVEKGGEKLIVHPNKGGYVYVYDRNLGFKDAWPLVKNINFIEGVDEQGKLVGRRDMEEGEHTNLCPAIAGGISWNSGTYNPQTGLYYKVGQEWCMDLEVVKTTPILEPQAQLNIGANFTLRDPEGGVAHGHVSARDPVTGEMAWEISYPEPPLASLLSTGGNLLFVPDARGNLTAFNATTGEALWSHNNGVGHNGGIISYSAGGRQYVAVMAGWGSLVGDEYPRLFGEPYTSMPTDTGAIIAFTLE